MICERQKTTAHLVAMGTSFGRERMARRLTRMRYWVILVRRCLFLWTRNLGQYASCSSIWAMALAYSPLSLQEPCAGQLSDRRVQQKLSICAAEGLPDLLPKLVGRVCPLNAFETQVQPSIFLPDGGISGVGQGTGASVAETCDVVLVPAEVLSLRLHFVAAKVVVDDLQGSPGGPFLKL